MKPHLRNVSSLLASDAGSRIIGFFVTAYLARTLGPGGFGILSIGLAVLGHLSVAGSPGMQVVETRNVAAQKAGLPERVGGVLEVRLLLSVILIIATWLVTGAFVRSGTLSDVILLYALSLVPYAILLDWYFQGTEDFLHLGMSRLLMYGVFGFLVVVLVRGPLEVRMAPVAFLAGNCVAVIFLGGFYVSRTRRLPLSWVPGQWLPILRDNLPVGLALLLAQLVSNFPPLVVGYFLAEREVGMYSAALKLVFFVLVLDRLFNALFLPVATRFWATKKDELPLLLNATLKGLIIIVLPIVAGTIVLAPQAIRIVYGGGFDDAIPLLRIMAGFFMLTMVNSVFVCLLVGSGNERRYTLSMAVGTGVLALAVIALTPVAGTAGASWALLIGEGATLSLMVFNARGVMELPPVQILIRPLIGCAVMGGILWAVYPVSVVLACIAGIASYGVVVLLSSGLSREEFRFLLERFV